MIGIVVALEKESVNFLALSKNVIKSKLADKTIYEGSFFEKQFVMIISGIGKVSASLSTQLIIDKFSPQYIINFGLAGGKEGIKVKNFYAVNKACQYDFDVSMIDDVPKGYIQEYKKIYFDCNVKGLDFLEKVNLASGDTFIDSDDKIKSVSKMDCSVFDMEGCAIAQTCCSNNIPLVIIKGISDIHRSGIQAKQFMENYMQICQEFPQIIKKVINNIINN